MTDSNGTNANRKMPAAYAAGGSIFIIIAAILEYMLRKDKPHSEDLIQTPPTALAAVLFLLGAALLVGAAVTYARNTGQSAVNTVDDVADRREDTTPEIVVGTEVNTPRPVDGVVVMSDSSRIFSAEVGNRVFQGSTPYPGTLTP